MAKTSEQQLTWRRATISCKDIAIESQVWSASWPSRRRARARNQAQFSFRRKQYAIFTKKKTDRSLHLENRRRRGAIEAIKSNNLLINLIWLFKLKVERY